MVQLPSLVRIKAPTLESDSLVMSTMDTINMTTAAASAISPMRESALVKEDDVDVVRADPLLLEAGRSAGGRAYASSSDMWREGCILCKVCVGCGYL